MPEQKEERVGEVKRYEGETVKATTEIHFVQRIDKQYLVFIRMKRNVTFYFNKNLSINKLFSIVKKISIVKTFYYLLYSVCLLA